jgi:hypothetical protein
MYEKEVLMKKFIYFYFLFLFISQQVYSDDYVIRYWNDNDQIAIFEHNSFKYTWQFQRFDIPSPCKIKAYTLYLSGKPANVKVVLLGHQGGSPIPNLFMSSGKNVLSTEQFQFQGSQKPIPITITLQTPIDFYNDQCFVGFYTDDPDSTYFNTTVTNVNPSCQSPEGGTFNYQTLTDFKSVDSTYNWRVGSYAYFCDLVVEFIWGNTKGYFPNRTVTSGLSPSLTDSTIAWGDINNDGYLDVLIGGRLYLNTQDGGFKEITTKAGLSGKPAANAFIDVDNDGDLDIIFLNSNPQGTSLSKLYLNDGNGNFVGKDINLPAFRGVSAFSIADINNDGYPDIFIAQSWSTDPPNLLSNYMLINNKNNTFTLKGGLCQTPVARRTLGTQFVDYDDDGDLDLFVTNYYLEQDELWENKGDLVFTDVAADKAIDMLTYQGKTYSNYGMGVDWYDFDNDGDLDLMLPQYCPTNFIALGFQGTTIYRNSNGKFTNTFDFQKGASSLGIEYEEAQSGGACGDIDNDGLVDLILTTYYGCRYVDLYKQNTDHTFSNVTFEWGLNRIATGDDAAWVDFDNDGRLDLAMSMNRNFALYKNLYNPTIPNNWLELDLRSEVGNSQAIGAKVKVYTPERVYTQEVTAGRGRNIQKPSRLHFGLGNSNVITHVDVRWPGSKTYLTYYNIKINEINKIVEKSVSVEENKDLINHNSLNIVGANPINDRLQIEFQTAKNNYVKLALYDLQGNQVSNIMTQYLNPGKYNIINNVQNLPVGIYFVRLTADGENLYKTIIINR